MHIRTWPAATPMHLYVQVNANKYDSDLPYAQDERNLAFNEQTTHPGKPLLTQSLSHSFAQSHNH